MVEISGRLEAVVAAARDEGDNDEAGVRMVCDRCRDGVDERWLCMTVASAGEEKRR